MTLYQQYCAGDFKIGIMFGVYEYKWERVIKLVVLNFFTGQSNILN